MKKIINLTVLSITGLAFTACQKSNPVTPPTQEKAQQTTASTTTLSSKLVRAYMKSDGWCSSAMSVNCVKLPEIVVTASARQILITASQGTSHDVAEAFRDPELETLVNELPSDYLTALLSGDYYIAVSNEDSNEICFIAGTSSPVSLSDMEFAFQFSK